MKTTAQRLSEVYCRPTTEEEWAQFGYFPSIYCLYISSISGHIQLTDNDWAESNRSEIPVQHFQDLRNDSIVGWRLEEDGFVENRKIRHLLLIDDVVGIYIAVNHSHVSLWVIDNPCYMRGIKTYTQLINLIEMIG
jgi:hypothetical protein